MVLEGLINSLYSKNFYGKVALEGTGNGFGFLALISLFGTITITILMGVGIFSIPEQNIDSIVSQIPKVSIINGELSIDRPSPYFIKSDNRTIVIIDASDESSKIPADEIFKTMKNDRLEVYATKTQVYYKKDIDRFEVLNLSETKNPVTFDDKDVGHWVHIGKILIIPFIAIFIYFGVLIYQIIRMLIYSLFGLIFNSSTNANFDYATIQRLTSYAIWPSILMWIIFAIFSAYYYFLISFIITIAYLYFAIKSAKPVLKV